MLELMRTIRNNNLNYFIFNVNTISKEDISKILSFYVKHTYGNT